MQIKWNRYTFKGVGKRGGGGGDGGVILENWFCILSEQKSYTSIKANPFLLEQTLFQKESGLHENKRDIMIVVALLK